MNPLILTKVSKFMLIGSSSAYLSFASKHNPMLRQGFFYLLGGLIAVIVIVLLWDGRDDLTNQPTEDGLNTLLSVANNQPVKRQYFLSNKTRIELIIGLAVVSVCTLVGAL
jgi:hypothetical protein